MNAGDELKKGQYNSTNRNENTRVVNVRAESKLGTAGACLDQACCKNKCLK